MQTVKLEREIKAALSDEVLAEELRALNAYFKDSRGLKFRDAAIVALNWLLGSGVTMLSLREMFAAQEKATGAGKEKPVGYG